MMTRILVFQEWFDISFPNIAEVNRDSLFVLGVKTEMDQGSTNRTDDRSPPVRMNSTKPTCHQGDVNRKKTTTTPLSPEGGGCLVRTSGDQGTFSLLQNVIFSLNP